MAAHFRIAEPAPDLLDGMSLPGWLYHDEEFLGAEKRAFLRAAPQVVCHVSDIAQAGEWRRLDYLGESVIVMRGDVPTTIAALIAPPRRFAGGRTGGRFCTHG